MHRDVTVLIWVSRRRQVENPDKRTKVRAKILDRKFRSCALCDWWRSQPKIRLDRIASRRRFQVEPRLCRREYYKRKARSCAHTAAKALPCGYGFMGLCDPRRTPYEKLRPHTRPCTQARIACLGHRRVRGLSGMLKGWECLRKGANGRYMRCSEKEPSR
eukprot:IDg10418t1